MRAATREEWLAKRWVRPFASRLGSPLVWRFNRRGVARGVALGLFAAFAIPVAQTPFAAVFAFAARANLPVAAACTLVTNPLTVPFVYYLAYRLGSGLLPMQAADFAALAADAGPMGRALAWTMALAGPTYLGLLLFGAVGAVGGWLAVRLGWRWRVGHRWRCRRRRLAGQPLAVASCPEFG